MSHSVSLRTSGDARADGRYEYARAAFAEKDFVSAADLAQQVLERAHDFAAAHALKGRALAALDRPGEAINALHQALALAPEDELGVRLDLARLGALDPQAAITDAYVRALFDNYAPRFDRHLTDGLGYCGPERVMDALQRAGARAPSRFARVIDLGCGTGLMAKALVGRYDTIEGVDLSGRMLEQARKAGLYTALHEGHLTSFLSEQGEQTADLVVAADVLIYLSALDEVFAQSHRVLKEGGLLAYTVQAHSGTGVILGADGRYAHSSDALSRLAADAGLTSLLFEEVSVRQDRDEPVPGFIAVLQRRA
ncbi:class I SAM-dependent DNA methyltransferase [Microvirga brassicacearum]|uniref:Methyltransferase domain-containing protein n=1 Tax=Microvirga brassicacearum TaxID=2580413 RepID=A0A5N3P8B1_9HYPH|nr:methyltransferase domain-containing protein [Microvirga brassicacearum]KAB0265979.1 methyltransferase domain-containing protein [Microvirga brassicacearum]